MLSAPRRGWRSAVRSWATSTWTGRWLRPRPLTAPFQDFITRYAWGEIWSRPGLSRAERSMITLTALVVLRQEEELAMHLRAALRNGLTPGQIGEVLLHTAVYAGVPAANRAFAIARQVLAEAG